MLKEERFNHILQKLTDHRRVTLTELSAELPVSEDTVRRDIEELSRNGKLTKVRGGAIPHSPNAMAHAFKDRIHISEADKQVIAEKALQLLKPGQVILMDGGTTIYTLATRFPPNLNLTVVTNNLPVANFLADHPAVEVLVIGGKLFKSSRVTMGMEAMKLLGTIRPDIYFTGICSLHHEFGITGPDLEESELKRAMVACASSTVALTTLNKIGTAEPFHICDIKDVDNIITEADGTSPLFEPYRQLGITIL